MHNLIDDSYFWGERHLPKLKNTESVTLSQAASAMSSEIDMYIAKYQKYYLQAMFGDTIAADLPDEIAEMLYDEETKTSPIADCVYFKVMKEQNNGVMLPTGNKTLTIQNTQITNPKSKLVDVWNAMVDFNKNLHQKLSEMGTIGDLNYETDIYNVLVEMYAHGKNKDKKNVFEYTNEYL